MTSNRDGRVFWTADRLSKAEEVVKQCYTVQAACIELSRLFERLVTPFNIAHAFKSSGRLSPRAFLRVADNTGTRDTIPVGAPDDPIGPIDVSDFEPDECNELIPDGQRLKGVSTLLKKGEEVAKWVKTDRASLDPPDTAIVPDHFSVTNVSTQVGPQGEMRIQWLKSKKNEADRFQQFYDAVARASEAYRGLVDPVPCPAMPDNDLMVVFGIGDPHIGMMSWGRETGASFDLKIAERELFGVVGRLVDRSPQAQKALIVNVGDYFHADNESQLTPGHGNKLDVDGRWPKVAEVGINIMRRLIERALNKYPEVEVHNASGNHDPQMSIMLATCLRGMYEREPRVTIADNVQPRSYVRFGKNLIGITHGHNTKDEALPGLMAIERRKDWGEVLYCLWLSGHIHHLTRKEYPGGTVDHLRTIAPNDAWHNGKGYMSMKSLVVYLLDKEYGEIGQLTEPLRRFQDLYLKGLAV